MPAGGEVLTSSRLRRARVGVSLAFLLFGAVYFTWAARLPAIKDDLGLSNGELAVALVGLGTGALAGCSSAASWSRASGAGGCWWWRCRCSASSSPVRPRPAT